MGIGSTPRPISLSPIGAAPIISIYDRLPIYGDIVNEPATVDFHNGKSDRAPCCNASTHVLNTGDFNDMAAHCGFHLSVDAMDFDAVDVDMIRPRTGNEPSRRALR